jgi:hypothetical protein
MTGRIGQLDQSAAKPAHSTELTLLLNQRFLSLSNISRKRLKQCSSAKMKILRQSGWVIEDAPILSGYFEKKRERPTEPLQLLASILVTGLG